MSARGLQVSSSSLSSGSLAHGQRYRNPPPPFRRSTLLKLEGSSETSPPAARPPSVPSCLVCYVEIASTVLGLWSFLLLQGLLLSVWGLSTNDHDIPSVLLPESYLRPRNLSIMSERGRIPRRLIDDRRGYPDVRMAHDHRGYPDTRAVGDHRAYPDARPVDRRPYPDIRAINDHRAYPGIHAVDRRGYPDVRDGLQMRGAPRPHPAVLEEEFELQEVELRRLLADNRALVEERDILHREVQAGRDEVGHLNMIIADINVEKEDYINKLVDKRRKLEAELRATEPLRDEVVQLRGDIDKLVGVRKELSAEAASLMQELAREKSGNQQLTMLKAEIDGLRQEIIHVRTACALEQKGNFELVEQRKAMEKNMNSMAQEIDQMRTELAKFDVRPWGTGGTYGIQMSSPEGTFSTPYGDSYNIHSGVSEKGSLLPPESSSWSKYDKSHLQYR
ncbi:hypothetical protein EJB05_02733, partial [Eragrostis curvula]